MLSVETVNLNGLYFRVIVIHIPNGTTETRVLRLSDAYEI
jgi:hypothetical protein